MILTLGQIGSTYNCTGQNEEILDDSIARGVQGNRQPPNKPPLAPWTTSDRALNPFSFGIVREKSNSILPDDILGRGLYLFWSAASCKL
jgi:hypothetical protein